MALFPRNPLLLLLVFLLLRAVPAWAADPSAQRHTTIDMLDLPCGAPAPPPARVDSAGLPGQWKTVALPLVLPDSACPSQVSWFRLRAAGAPAGAALALYVPRVKADGRYAVYRDGWLLHQAAVQGPVWNSNRVPLWAGLPAPAATAGAPAGEILLRLERTPRRFDSITSIWLGDERALRWRYQARLMLQTELPAMCGAAFPAVGLLALLIWFKRRTEWRFLIYFCIAATTFLRGVLFFLGHPLDNDIPTWLRMNSMYWMILASHFFILELHERPQRWLTRCLTGMTVLTAIATLPALGLVDHTAATPAVLSITLLLAGGAVIVAGLAASWRRSGSGLLVAACFGAGILVALSDGFLQSNQIDMEGVYLGPYSNILCFLTFSYIMLRRYRSAVGEVERSKETLLQRLAQREAELADSFERLLRVEEQATLSRERQRMMQDMHDGVGSSLRSALWAVEKGNLEEAAVAEVLKECIDDLKLAIDSMEPVEADLLLLLAALRYRLGNRLENSGIALVWGVTDVPALDWLSPVNALHILRILQEAFANIIKHANATQVRVGTGVERDGVTVSIEDNGKGFAVDGTAQGGKGLSNQKFRTTAIGGDIQWTSGAGGTCLKLWLPLTQARTGARHPSGEAFAPSRP
ncbi:sensor histidine kinase [Pseudoduganella namucuonensis]|uniref:histidine kinase n=1 Tax=Pseudoduganella namucuonensis TaxID=1035707 RepID=A0A1I7ILD6_9BURK|nr:ATP-binding protein [Pseudoduganella namucuonensis]SFU73732.1 Signal transduction histidine kinase [Pseudoduganella namucuonensis]